MIRRIKPGCCPKCGSKSLQYDMVGGGLHANTNLIGVSYDFKCRDCGCRGTEWYELNYVETTAEGEQDA